MRVFSKIKYIYIAYFLIVKLMIQLVYELTKATKAKKKGKH